MQAETGADVSVDDDGDVGVVSIAAVDIGAVHEAERQIKLILDPPTAEVGVVYAGKVVNITKFGAFVNILPGRDGLVHISKLGGGKRINKVEDVLELGQDLEVKVDDIDPNGKISLTPTSDADPKATDGGAEAANGTGSQGGPTGGTEAGSDGEGPSDEGRATSGGGRREANFSASYDERLAEAHGDLGPAPGRGGSRPRRPAR
ncbi:MAG: S1 RNA-binding domain-containing protein [Microthrixaceae bacterium]|nr:S1 RNA-binding domain-containing protein [Microthrixaceae bacterium]